MFQILFVFNLISMSFLLFQQLPVSAAVSMLSVTFFSYSFSPFFHAFAITQIENKKVLEYNQMVNVKLLIMLHCKQLNIWL